MKSGWSVPGVAIALLFSAAAPASPEVDAAYPAAHALYVELHQHPELSGHEVQTAATLAQQLRALGYEVTEHVGGTGLVAVLRNGAGQTVLLRTELDALPVEEKTGLPFASKVHAKDDAGHDVSVGHMCGHDLHMSALVATGGIMAHSKDSWRGTLILIGQPAEETVQRRFGHGQGGAVHALPAPGRIAGAARRQRASGRQVGVVDRAPIHQRRFAAHHDLTARAATAPHRTPPSTRS